MENIFYILKKKNASDIIYDMQMKGNLKLLLPELSALDTTDVGHKNNFIHTLGVLNNVIHYCGNNYNMRLVALLHDIGKIDSRRTNENGKWTFHDHEKVGAYMSLNIMERLDITDKNIIAYVYRMIKYHGRVKMHRDVTESAIRRLDNEIGQDIIFDLIDFCKCDLTTKFEDKRLRIQSGLDTIKQRIIEVRQKDEEAKWRSPITGTIIMNILGVGTGPMIGKIKSVTDSKIKSGEWTEEDALNYIKSFKK